MYCACEVASARARSACRSKAGLGVNAAQRRAVMPCTAVIAAMRAKPSARALPSCKELKGWALDPARRASQSAAGPVGSGQFRTGGERERASRASTSIDTTSGQLSEDLSCSSCRVPPPWLGLCAGERVGKTIQWLSAWAGEEGALPGGVRGARCRDARGSGGGGGGGTAHADASRSGSMGDPEESSSTTTGSERAAGGVKPCKA